LFHFRNLSFAASALLALGSFVAMPIGVSQSASAETIISQIGADIDGEPTSDESGYSVSLSSNGLRVAIGARYNSGAGRNAAGHVRIYDWKDDSWVQVGLDIDGEAANDYSGYAVSLSSDGSRVAIGAPGNDETGIDAGHVRLYDYNGTSWVQVGLDVDGEATGDYSGWSVALSSDGSRAAIGAHRNDETGIDAGHVRLYDYNGTSWVQVGLDVDGEAAGDYSGWSVALSSDGSRVAIGAYLNDETGIDAGHVRLYDYNGTAWVQVVADIDGEAAGDYSGFSVSLNSDGSRVAIGAPNNTGYDGHVRLYSIVNSAPAAPTPTTPAPYTGPLPINYSDRTPLIGAEVTISGLRLNLVTSCTVDGVDVEISNKSADSFVIVIPEGLESGLKDLVMFGPFGKLTAQDAFTVVTAKTNAGSFDHNIAVYAKGHKGRTLSWKIAGKWFKTTITSDYQVFRRKTVAVGLDVYVHLYLDGEKQLTKTVTTRE
jgi:hypothetical protein